jgi:DNA repair protein RadC
MVKIKDLPVVDRPREKLLRYKDAGRLKTDELFALVLGTGRKGENVISLSRRIVKTIHSAEPSSLLDALLNIQGVGRTKTTQILAIIELRKRLNDMYKTKEILSPADIWKDMLSTHTSKKEHFYVYYLDTRNNIIKKELVSLGSLNASIVHPREVFEPAIRHLCAHIILSHNHPSGDSTPSDADILVTKKLQNAGKILDIEVLDHVVVCEKDFTSMKEKGLM